MKYTSNTCKHCNTQIKIIRPRDRFKEYCNRSCASKYLGKLKHSIIKCVICNNDFVKKQSTHIYCSNTCRHKAMEVTHIRKCQRCGKDFKLDNIAYERRGGGKYCSILCGTRKYNVDTNYFKEIDYDSSYWLGFMFADGYQDGNEMVINLSNKDADHLISFKDEIKYEGSLLYRTDRTKYKNTYKYHDKVTLKVASVEICSTLDSLGCVRAKSKIVKYPQIAIQYDSTFIRGVFDGDGCISISKRGNKKYAKASIYSESTDFIMSINKILIDNGINSHINNKGKVCSICSKDSLISLYNLLYREGNYYLKRKKDKFTEMLSYWGLLSV